MDYSILFFASQTSDVIDPLCSSSTLSIHQSHKGRGIWIGVDLTVQRTGTAAVEPTRARKLPSCRVLLPLFLQFALASKLLARSRVAEPR